jgi:hypothetical protein
MQKTESRSKKHNRNYNRKEFSQGGDENGSDCRRQRLQAVDSKDANHLAAQRKSD